MTRVQNEVQDIVSPVRVKAAEGMSDEVARALFQAWKNDTPHSIGDLFRAVESKGREEARDESKTIIENLCDALGERGATRETGQTVNCGVAA